MTSKTVIVPVRNRDAVRAGTENATEMTALQAMASRMWRIFLVMGFMTVTAAFIIGIINGLNLGDFFSDPASIRNADANHENFGTVQAILVWLTPLTLLGVGLLVEPVREDVITGLATYSFLKFDAARVEKADPQKIEELRAQTIDRLRAMADLSEDYDSLALTIIGATEVVAGRTTDAFEQVIAKTEARRDAPDTTAEERERWVRELRGIRNYEAAARNARESGRSFEEEHERVRLLGDHVR